MVEESDGLRHIQEGFIPTDIHLSCIHVAPAFKQGRGNQKSIWTSVQSFAVCRHEQSETPVKRSLFMERWRHGVQARACFLAMFPPFERQTRQDHAVCKPERHSLISGRIQKTLFNLQGVTHEKAGCSLDLDGDHGHDHGR
jgi:hypothetical protein